MLAFASLLAGLFLIFQFLPAFWLALLTRTALIMNGLAEFRVRYARQSAKALFKPEKRNLLLLVLLLCFLFTLVLPFLFLYTLLFIFCRSAALAAVSSAKCPFFLFLYVLCRIFECFIQPYTLCRIL